MRQVVESLLRMILLRGGSRAESVGYRRTHHNSISRLVVTTLYIFFLSLEINL